MSPPTFLLHRHPPAGRSERLHGAIIPAEGEIIYLSPAFEEPKTRELIAFGADVRCWDEHEDPTALVIDTVRASATARGTLAIDPMTPFFTVDGLRRAGNAFTLVERRRRSPRPAACSRRRREIALIQRAMNITLEVHNAAARILRAGITTTEVMSFLAAGPREARRDAAGQRHRAVRRADRLPARRALSADPEGGRHGADRRRRGDRRLPLRHHAQLRVRRADRAAARGLGPGEGGQAAAFAAAKLGAPCEAVDAAPAA